MLGYDEIDGKLTPNKDAWIIKLIFEEYANGVMMSEILRHLKEKGARRLRVDRPFCPSVLYAILRMKRMLETGSYKKPRHGM